LIESHAGILAHAARAGWLDTLEVGRASFARSSERRLGPVKVAVYRVNLPNVPLEHEQEVRGYVQDMWDREAELFGFLETTSDLYLPQLGAGLNFKVLAKGRVRTAELLDALFPVDSAASVHVEASLPSSGDRPKLSPQNRLLAARLSGEWWKQYGERWAAEQDLETLNALRDARTSRIEVLRDGKQLSEVDRQEIGQIERELRTIGAVIEEKRR
jgi:hypothetical protein